MNPKYAGFQYEFRKLAARSKLQEHQARAIDRLKKEDALLLYHALGSGKSFTALGAADELGLPLDVIGPAALKHNFPKEKEKHRVKAKLRIGTYSKPIDDPNGILAYDEAHRMGRVGSKRSQYPENIKGKKTLFMTGTPVRNHPSELIPILRGLGIDISRDPKKFRQKFIEEINKKPPFLASILRGVKPGVQYKAKNIEELKKMVEGKVDYYKPPSDNYPSVKKELIEVEMTPEQNAAYQMALKQNPSILYKIRKGLHPSKTESKKMNAFLSATRQISNIPGKYNLKATVDDAPKIKAAVDEIKKRSEKDKNYRGVTYSNYLESGVIPLSWLLHKEKVPHAIFTGKQTPKQKKEIVDAYNKGKIKHLLISGAGAEGIDLKGTKLLQILEPHWNEARTEQVAGRAVRYKSHDHLPPEEREVVVQNLVSKPRKRGLIFKTQDMGTDEYLRMLGKEKSELVNQFNKALQSVSKES